MGAVAGIGLALGVAGIGLDVYGQKKEAESQKRQALLAQANARAQAADAISRGGSESARALGETDRMVGTQQASTAGRGFEVGVGTAQDFTDATNLIGSIDAITIRENARREAQGYLTDAYSYGKQASSISATPGITRTLLSGAGSVASTWFGRSNRNAASSMRNPGVYDERRG